MLSRRAGDPSGRPIVSAPRNTAIASSEAGAPINQVAETEVASLERTGRLIWISVFERGSPKF
jgi:hypothetical protein